MSDIQAGGGGGGGGGGQAAAPGPAARHIGPGSKAIPPRSSLRWRLGGPWRCSTGRSHRFPRASSLGCPRRTSWKRQTAGNWNPTAWGICSGAGRPGPESQIPACRPRCPHPMGTKRLWEQALRKLNLDILCALAATLQESQLAYELGRSLRDTANPPDQHPPELTLSRVFARDRIATLQGWLAELSSELAPPAAVVVAASLGRWSEFAAVTASTARARLRRVTARRWPGTCTSTCSGRVTCG